MAQHQDYYQVLGVPESATKDQIKRAYRKLAKKYHPDASPGDRAAEARFKEISEAYAVLSEEGKRKQYDQLRKYGAFAGAGARGRSGSAGTPGGAGIRFDEFDLRDLGAFGGIGDLFSSLFGGESRRAESRAENVETVVTIPFRVAALGGKVPIVVPVTETCPTCSGSGAAPGARTSVCSECKGTGQVSFGYGGFAVKRPCPACRGRGRVASERCGTCQGVGDVRTEKRIMIEVPPGTDAGTKLRLKGQGPRSRAGAAAGDLLVSFQVEPDRFFRREGLDVHCTVPVNMAQAVLGTRLKVRTLEGKHVVLRVPPGTQPGRKFRIKGQGIEKNGARGDQLVEIAVEIPARLSPEQEAKLREFAAAAGLRY
jgi:molecular chaperone DnaJ